MANRYWVGGSGTWNTTSTTNWSASSGGPSGASVPTAADSVFFDQAGTYTVTCTGALTCLDITVSAGTVTFATGTSPTFAISGSMSLVAGTVWSATGAITFNATTTGKTVTTNGTTLSGSVSFNGANGGWTLGSALTSAQSVSVFQGTFDTSLTGNYAVTGVGFVTTGSLTRTINLNGSTFTSSLNSANAFNASTSTGLTLNTGTSQINLTNSISGINSTGFTFYNVAFTSGIATAITITGANTFNTLSFAPRTSTGITPVTFNANQTIGTLTLSAGTAAAYRTFLASNTIGTQRTLSVGTLTAGAADYDFRDIAVTGTAAPLTGTRFGDCKGNSGITFNAAKTVYYRQTGNTNWGTAGAGSWSATSGGGFDATQFPLAQDTAVFLSSPTPYPSSGNSTIINAAYNIGTIDMSARTSNTMTLATGTTTPTIYGNWINGTGTTLTGTSAMTFAGRGSQTITSAGKAFTQSIIINSPSGSVTLQDAISISVNLFTLTAGTFDANGYNSTWYRAGTSGSLAKTYAFGSGTTVVTGGGPTAFNMAGGTNLTVTGSGIISFTAATSQTFAGGGIQTYPTLNQGGAGALTVTGSNGFANITNTYSATGATSVRFTAGTTNIFTAFNLTGAVGAVCTLGSTTTSQATLQKSSTWYMGANSTDSGNNTGLTFSAGGGIDYLSVSYINGTVVSAVNYGGFFPFFS